tara:strand:- start:72 stop:206 length:135 start_codon:yes stop_codon:yes gene_type:complete
MRARGGAARVHIGLQLGEHIDDDEEDVVDGERDEDGQEGQGLRR